MGENAALNESTTTTKVTSEVWLTPWFIAISFVALHLLKGICFVWPQLFMGEVSAPNDEISLRVKLEPFHFSKFLYL